MPTSHKYFGSIDSFFDCRSGFEVRETFPQLSEMAEGISLEAA
jgi:hypothetical protein